MYPFMFIRNSKENPEAIVIIATYDLVYSDSLAELGPYVLEPSIDLEYERYAFKNEAEAKKFIAEWWRTNVQG